VQCRGEAVSKRMSVDDVYSHRQYPLMGWLCVAQLYT
jgi:hypothetical protein